MEQFFQKAVIFADSHFGRSGDSPVANQDNLEFIDWMIERAMSWGAETCIFLGDYFHNRAAIGLASLDAGLRGLERISAAGFKQTIMLKGNHDLQKRANRDVSSLNMAAKFPTITLVRDPLTIGEVTFLPWLVGEEHHSLSSLRSRYVFAHLETLGAMMNARVACTGGSHAIDADSFKKIDMCYTGHFHQRQMLKNVCYIGSIMPFDFSDANDAQRGVALLAWGRDPIFEAWPAQPLFYTATLSHLLNNLDDLRPKMTVRATVDIDLQREEAQQIREMLMDGYGLRRLELPELNSPLAMAASTTTVLQTVEQIVIEGLNSIDSKELDCKRLVDIFVNLPRL
jgi:DNA repair exonuclease SbcCD nuclease subunit